MTVDSTAHLLDWREEPDRPSLHAARAEPMSEPLGGGRTWLTLCVAAGSAFALTMLVVAALNGLLNL